MVWRSPDFRHPTHVREGRCAACERLGECELDGEGLAMMAPFPLRYE
ncbi:hypothetical protein DAD186_16610 [Dermabacter vaginalis]|uniref:Uncharacterized protein n=1 Tax=Dermabacter vaginalis TaxID=1630135 RepID=A0A1B0ZJN3_9MICO|nr:hypothetical protein DAD186_16610 [Dermabacter vaginalis]